MSVGPTRYDELALLRGELERERQARLEAEACLADGLRELYLREQELGLLEAVAALVDRAADADATLESAMERICRHALWSVGHLFVVEAAAPGAEPRLKSSGIWHCFDPERFALFRAASVEDEDATYDRLPGQALGTGRPAWTLDITQDEDFSRAAVAQQAGLRSAFAFPVLLGREVVAVLEFFSDRDSEPDESLLRNMARISAQLGRVIERQRLGAALGDQRQALAAPGQDAALREQLHLMNDILASVTQGVAYEDAQGRLHSYNRQFLELLDISWDYAESLPAMRDITRAILDPGKRKALFVLNGKSSDDTGWERLDGDLIGYEWDHSKNYILDMTSGYVVEMRRQPLATGGYVWVLTDATHHIYTQESLRESEARWRSLTHLSADLYWEMDCDFRITKVEGQGTSNMQRVSGLLGKSADVLRDVRNMSVDFDEQRALMNAHRSFHDLELQLPSGGEWIWVSISGEPKYDARGRFAGYRGVIRDIAEQKRAQDEIKQLAFYDELTGLPNRRLMYDRLERAQAVSAREGTHGALMFIDLDNFKKINDTLGHKCGDQLLVQVAARLRDSLRTSDTLSRLSNDDAARLGGDEFVVVLDGLAGAREEAAAKVGIVANKVLATLNRPYDLDGQPVRSTPSIGVELFQGRGENMAELMRRADLAMYQAKSRGRNMVCFYTEAMQAQASS
jgi:diguanylate cyclase (GGDEF)-like protein/PAS domain S-box-containing protein